MLEWARDANDDDVLGRGTVALRAFWSIRGLEREERTWLTLALERVSKDSPARLGLLGMASRRAFADGDLDRAEVIIAERREAAEQLGDATELMEVTRASALLAGLRGDRDAARTLYLEVRRAAGELGHAWMLGYATINLAGLEFAAGDYRAALDYSAAAVEILREDGDESGLNVALGNCGWAALLLRDPEAAEGYFRQAVLVAAELESSHRVLNHALGLGAALVATGKPGRGVQLLAAVLALCEARDMAVFADEIEERLHEQALSDARAALDGAAFAAAWARGRAMTPEAVVPFCTVHGDGAVADDDAY
jgi:non-specific serine/threonine protein kinase